MKKIMMFLLENFTTVSARLIATIQAPQRRYWAALSWVQCLEPLASFFQRCGFMKPQNTVPIKVILLQRILSAITRYAYIELPLRIINEKTLDYYRRKYNGFLLCGAHFGMTLAIFSLMEKKGQPIISISDGGLTTKAYGWNWGCTNSLRLIKRDAHSFVKARKKLAEGEIVLAYSDYVSDDDLKNNTLSLSPNVFEFAYKLSVPILFFGADLAPDGVIEIDFVESSYPIVTTTEALAVVKEDFRLFVAERMKKKVHFSKNWV